jgi:hypothetical protein
MLVWPAILAGHTSTHLWFVMHRSGPRRPVRDQPFGISTSGFQAPPVALNAQTLT